MQNAFGGTIATTVYEFDRQFGVNVRAAPKFRDSIEAIRNAKIDVTTDSGTAYIPLESVADISLVTGATFIFHEKNKRALPITFSVRDRDLGGAIAEAKERIGEAIKLPQGYRIEWTGEFEELEEARKPAFSRRPPQYPPHSRVALRVVQFNPRKPDRYCWHPFRRGGRDHCAGHLRRGVRYLRGDWIVSLFGISVMDGILMMTFFNHMKKTGSSAEDAMFHAAMQRMRPMLMTALSAFIGLLPAALSTGIGSQVQQPLATVVVGGMSIGPVLLLIVVPVLRVLLLSAGTLRNEA